MLDFLVALFFLVLCLSLNARHALRQAHHGYWGVLGYVAARWLGWSWASYFFLVLLADDMMQHLIQLRFPFYRSPMHHAYGFFYHRWEWLRSLNRWFDRLFA